jgi:hypothetical protein
MVARRRSPPTIPETVPETEQSTQSVLQTPARPITFSPIRLGRERMRAQPANVQHCYRQAVRHTLDEISEASGSEQTREVTRRYWDHVQTEIPESPEDPARNVRRYQ